jgi:hypothetical protein
MSEDRITLEPPRPPLPESAKPLQPESAFMSAQRAAFPPKVAPVQNGPRPAVKEEPPRPAPRVEEPPEKTVQPTRPTPTLLQQENRERARRIARMKFGFYKLTGGLILVNGLFFAASNLELEPAGRYWSIWPAAISVLVLIAQYVRAFILKGRSIQAYIDSFVTRIEEREVSRELDRM